jgi:hypothetical protein
MNIVDRNEIYTFCYAYIFLSEPFCLWFCMGAKLVSNIKGGIQTKGVWEQGTEENIWTEERW